MIIRDVTDMDLSAILAIHNAAVAETTAIWDDAAVDFRDRQAWLAARRTAGYPVLACEVDGVLAGYASFGDFRPRSGYRHTVEHSVYVEPGHRRRGIARLLLEALIKRAEGMGKHAMIGGIEARNTASIALHAGLGFVEVGRLPQVGAKFGQWLDLIFMQRMLDDRVIPPR
ncbi:GNAT family N-acetyltransferase [Sphingomonas arantia]|uniref:GNAT family N-acetyltransferase n=1 Tax=Sphingomonas arantia TaxID=1460676 RepID=A0ABW4TZQ5_9SPHN